MKFDDLPAAYEQRVEAKTRLDCEQYFDAFIESYAEDTPVDTAIVSDELMAFARRWPGDDDPHYGISLIRNIDFDDDYWPRLFELTVRYELSLPNYLFPQFRSTCPTPASRLEFYRDFRSTIGFRWYRRKTPSAVKVRVHDEEGMLDVIAAMTPAFCCTEEDAEP